MKRFYEGLLMSVFLVAAITLAACTAKIEGGSPAPLATLPPKPPVVQTSIVEGRWVSPCMNITASNHIKVFFQFASQNFAATMAEYEDAQCVNKKQEATKRGTFAVTGDNVNVKGAKNINITEVNSSGQTVVAYDIFKLDGNTLYFSQSPGNSEETRPKELNLRLGYKRAD